MTQLDRCQTPRVSIAMDRNSPDLRGQYGRCGRSKTIALVAGVLLALAACGGGNKKAKTKPTGSTGSVKTVGMNDGAPTPGNNVKTTTVDGSGNPAGGTTPGGTTPGGTTPGGTTPGGTTPGGTTPGGATAGGAPTPPPLKPPVREPTMAEVKGQLQSHLIRAKNALRQNDPNRAIAAAKSALGVYSNSVSAVVYLAQAYYMKKLDDTAEVLLTMVLSNRAKKAQAEKHPGLYYTLGLIYNRTSRKALAAKAFATVVNKLDSNHKGALLNLGAHHLRNKVYPDAQRLLEKLVVTLKVSTAGAYTNLASAYRGRSADAAVSKAQRRSLLKKAEYYYKKALFVDKSYADAVFNLGLLYLDATPFPFGNGDMDKLKRLEKAKVQFDDYQRLAKTNQKKVRKLQKLARKRIKKEKKRLKKLRKKNKKKNS